ncbi:hypothetical protein [Phenylobacterium sp.]|uniref:hypothetical protein n=1 Tax=Phenylobacterium sp. TaxID=1871053 RepID=UPI0011F5AB49|nr:hypothetical protein [Phenylobacterium sp.]THD70853.1 MAG: hypothetical protein E8A12_02480 [Phenylobacterium sp.]
MAFQIDRRQAMLAGLSATTTTLPAMSARAAATPDPLAGAALYADVKAYAGLGEHRTGTPGDDATTVWMERALKAAGYAVERQAFDYPVFDPGHVDITLNGRALESFPYWTPVATPAGGVTAPLSLIGGAAKIALIDLPSGAGGPLDSPPPAQVVAAVDSGVLAVVAITESPLGELSALNRNPKAPPWKVPVVLAAGRDGDALKAAAAAGRSVTVRLEGRSVTRPAHNVIGHRTGPGKPIVISTPKSGWFHCAGERGAGIAIWLGLARWLAATSDRNIIVVASAGHEFDGYGAHHFTQTLAPKPADTRLWVAIGANVAAYDFALEDGQIARQPGPQAARTLGVSSLLMDLGAKAFAGQRGYDKPLDLDAHNAPGELATFRKLGYRPLVGLVAGHPLHHTRRDLADVTDGAMLEPVARGLQAMLREA